MRIGFFGGTFSPPHKGHLEAAKSFYIGAKLDKLIIIPAKVSPFKTDLPATASEQQRMDMCSLCFGKLSNFGFNIEISDMELKNDATSYTYMTVLSLKELYPKDDIIMYVGSDMFYSLGRWKNSHIIFNNCSIYTKCRVENEKEQMLLTSKEYEKNFNANITVSSDGEYTVSSTQIRNLLSVKNEVNDESLLTEEVFRYIIENRLYCGEK